jgi:hypothetical protein
MRVILHGVAIIVAMVTFSVLVPSIRDGHVLISAGILMTVAALFAVYAVIVVGLGLLNGIPVRRWPHIARQLFRGDEHDV